MNITCPHCQTKLNVPDEKIPKDRDSSFKCPKCSEKITVPASRPQAVPPPVDSAGKQSAASARFSSQGRSRAMVCLGEGTPAGAAMAVLGQMWFEVETPTNVTQALKKLGYHIYPLVIIDESFDQGRGLSDLIAHVNNLDMSLRRRICLILISRQSPTGDRMAALHASVNHIIGFHDMALLPQILSEALIEHENFYIVYNESMKAAGKA
ncbi:zinc-ribbon domain-containing protein [Desulfospira joergensenii]|uniref:zinc-ribbon domain-containing protein n=1 Tax=Desulfospira joergensenii TaxID=53329 RepID=UPI0003B364E7|nr:zinc-ribbon domain-containing protein [Desulfospira joergensenii]